MTSERQLHVAFQVAKRASASMRWLFGLLAFRGVAVACLGLQIPLQLDGIPRSTFDELVRFTKFSSAVYQLICPSPLGTTLVDSFYNLVTDVHGFVARDDDRREIIVAFRGTQQLADVFTDENLVLVPFSSPGVQLNTTSPVAVHAGFLIAFNSISRAVISSVREQLDIYNRYSVVVTGHSLGGSLASLGGLSLKAHFPTTHIRLFTFGQARTGNAGYADLVESFLGAGNIYRAVHTWDGVPTLVPEYLGYRHHVTEYWQFEDPAIPSTVRRCSGQEDPTCSVSIPSTGINVAHGIYFRQVMGLDASLCL